MSKISDFVKSRKGATMILASAALVGSIFISSNISVVRVVDGDQTAKVIASKNKSSVEIIRQAGFALSGNDSYAVNGADSSFSEIEIIRAIEMTVIDGGEKKTISAVSGTVADALRNSEIALPEGEDSINVNLQSEVDEGMVITIDRVKYVTDTKTKTVKYKTVTKNDGTLAVGKTKVSVEGVNGEKKVTTVKKYVNGKLTDTKVTEKVTKKAVNNKVLSGTGTAYTARKGAKTSTGKSVKVGLVAVDPRVIPYGTKLYIVSADGKYNYGYAVAADTGGALRSGRVLVDLFYNTERECVNFGRRQVKVYILD